ncbi:MAG: family 20 glycosylhydrolase [Bacteroidota bacterium]
MKITALVLTGCLAFFFDNAQTGASALIPAPVSVQEKDGAFILSSKTIITAPVSFHGPAALLAMQLGIVKQPVLLSKSSVKSTGNKIIFTTANPKDSFGGEGYKLSIQTGTVSITAQTTAGMLKGIFTLLQLRLLQPDMQKIPCASITDKPRFAYRGLQLDVSRNFYPVSFIKKYIDLMALYKYNTFHWHLVDGAGWRLQIKKYPLLTQVAAFRTHSDWKSWWKNGKKYSAEGDPGAYGGFYTQEDAKEIVAYAAQRGITVIPEIEMPGHSEEVLAVYPQLSCSGIAYTNSEFCIGNDETFTFLEDVLTEVMAIFPSVYIHVGGDEASTAAWKNCPKCQQRKKDMGLSTEHELQSYLIKRIQKFLNAHNRKLLGWDEILEGGLAPGATVMNWRSEKNGIEAAEQDHDVIMTPNAYYLDAYQSDPNTQPEAIGGYLPIQRIYNYEPVPAELNPAKKKYYIGTEACVWTEYMPTTYQVEYMVYPRAIALSETAWSDKGKKNFDNFQSRLQAHYLLLQRLGVNYYRPSGLLTLHVQPDYDKKQDLVSFISEQYKPEIHYTTDNSIPGPSSPIFNQPFYTSNKTIITAAIFKAGTMIGEPSTFTTNYHKAIGKKVTFNNLWSDSYPAQKDSTLTNGIEGSLTYGDKQWLGYLKDFDVTLDMESVQALNSLSIRFMQQPGPGVFLPSYVEVLVSTDGKNFTSFDKQVNTIPFDEPKTIFKSFSFDLKNKTTRYIRIVAPNVKGGFMFTDEIIVF